MSGDVREASATTPIVERWQTAEDISFRPGSIEIQAKCGRKIARLAAWLKRNPLFVVALDGHADQDLALTGEAAGLHADRVRAVRDVLVAAGVAPTRIQAGSFGDRRPLCRRATADCREANRRVEVLVGSPSITAARP